MRGFGGLIVVLGVVVSVSCPVWSAEDWGLAEPWVVKVTHADWDTLREMASLVEPWEIDAQEHWMLLDVDADLRDRLESLGFKLELDEKQTQRYHEQLRILSTSTRQSGIPGYPCYRTVEETLTTAQQLTNTYPDLAEWIEIGQSWERTQDPGAGYPMVALRITNRNITGTKPVMYVLGAIHARELTTAELATRFSEYLLDHYGVDPEATWIVDHRDIYVVLQANPDGRKMAEAGESWRKNTNDDECSSGSYGIDLNRNFPFEWACCGGSSSDPCDATYHGVSAVSEPEADAIISHARTVIPDQRPDDQVTPAPDDTAGLWLDLHSYGGDVLWPWGFTSTAPPNASGINRFARKLAYFNEYTAQGSTYAVDGATKDFGYGEFGVPAYTIELGTNFFQDCSSFETTIFPDNLNMLVYAAKACDQPYLNSLGPDPSDLTFQLTGPQNGTLTANIDDTRYYGGSEPTQSIAEAIYTINELPFDPGAVTLPMTAVDGAFDETAEAVQANVDLSGLGPGHHQVHVQGRDSDGDWGIISSLNVDVPDVNTYFEGYVKDSDTGQPIEATVRAAGFQTQSAVASGYYQMHVYPETFDLVFSADGYGSLTLEDLAIGLGEALRQDVVMCATTTVFEDDAETGPGQWTAEGTWAISSDQVHGGSFAWCDSPGGDYANSLEAALTSQVMDLSGLHDVKIEFWSWFELESGYDDVYLEYQIGGGDWIRIATFNGDEQAWAFQSFSVPALDGQGDVRIRFFLDTDGSQTRDGFTFDDFVVVGGPADCPQEVSWETMLAGWPQYPVTDLVHHVNTHR